MRRVLRELDLEDEAVASSWLTSRRRTRRAEPDGTEREPETTDSDRDPSDGGRG